MSNRSMIRAEAKKLYKEQTKGVPKRQRIPFSEFYKNYIKLKSGKASTELPTDLLEDDDFNFDDMVNVNMISDDDLEAVDEEETEENVDKSSDTVI